jgi:cyanate permease
MHFSWIGLILAILIPFLIVKKLQVSNIWMIPVFILEVIAYGICIFVYKMMMPILIIGLIVSALYFYQYLSANLKDKNSSASIDGSK